MILQIFKNILIFIKKRRQGEGWQVVQLSLIKLSQSNKLY